MENLSFPKNGTKLTKGKFYIVGQKFRYKKVRRKTYFSFLFYFTHLYIHTYIKKMTVSTPNSFPLGYFYIISKMNGLALDIDKSEPVKVKQ